jgi:hypothetical protein
MIMSDNIAAELDKRIEKQAQDAASGLVFKSHLQANLQAAYLTLLETCVHPSEFKRGFSGADFALAAAEETTNNAFATAQKRVQDQVLGQTTLIARPQIPIGVLSEVVAATFSFGDAVNAFGAALSARR